MKLYAPSLFIYKDVKYSVGTSYSLSTSYSYFFFVVIRITPFAPRTPYMEADASLRTSTDETNCGSMFEMSLVSRPSTRMSGLLSPLVPMPRIVMLPFLMVRPGTRPCR